MNVLALKLKSSQKLIFANKIAFTKYIIRFILLSVDSFTECGLDIC